MRDLLQHFVDLHGDANPDAVAIRCDRKGPVTYGKLREDADRTANLLVRRGMERGDRAVICTDRSADAIVAMLGALKADLIYVPVYDRSPPERIRAIIEDCGPRCIICSDSTIGRLLEATAAGPAIDLLVNLGGGQEDAEAGSFGHVAARSEIEAQDAKARDYRNVGTDTAHILYTSGSTGAPKGVRISHLNVASYIDWATSYFDIRSDDRILNTAPFNFDMSTFDIYCAQAAGAALCLAVALLLAKRIEREDITIWKAIPSLLRAMLAAKVVTPDRMETLRHVIFSGDVVSSRDLAGWMAGVKDCRYYIGYGPTEATGMSTCHRLEGPMEDAGEAVPLGRACADTEVRVLRADQSPAGPGEVGELYIGGSGISEGYWGDPGRTRDRFLAGSPGMPGAGRIYRTGDRGYCDDDGVLHFVGRDDEQVKIQGYRVELGDVRSALRSSENVEDAEVLTQEMESGDKCLIGVVVPRNGADMEGIARSLGRKLPRYMVPRQLLAVDEIPRSERGKVDRRKLRALVDRVA
jgi:amino acid adenylation domain-containing protein